MCDVFDRTGSRQVKGEDMGVGGGGDSSHSRGGGQPQVREVG